jgi:hypothetical protein
MVANLSRESSQLKTRATMAETQSKALQEHLGQQAKSNQQKVNQMKDVLKSAGIDSSKY